MQIDVHILFRIKPKYSSRHAGLCCSRNTPGTIILPRGLCTCCLLFWPLKTLSLNSHPFPGEQLSHPPILSSAVPTSRKPSLTPKSESGVPFVQVEPPQAIPSRSCPLSLSLYRNGSLPSLGLSLMRVALGLFGHPCVLNTTQPRARPEQPW